MFWFLIVGGWLICCVFIFLFFYGAGKNGLKDRQIEDLYDSMTKEERDYGFDIWSSVVITDMTDVNSINLKIYFAHFLKSLPMSILRSFLLNDYKIVIVDELNGEKYRLDLQEKKLYILNSEMNPSCFSLNRGFAKYVYENRELDRDINLVNCFDMECDKVKDFYFSDSASNGIEESAEKFFIELFVLYQVGYFKYCEDKKEVVKQSYYYIEKLYNKIMSCERIDSIHLAF